MGDDRLVKTLEMVDETYSGIPPDAILLMGEIARFLNDLGKHKLPQKGQGTDYYDARPYRHGDDPRLISGRISRRLGKSMVVERQDETRQPTFIWRKGNGSTTIHYDKGRLSKKEYLDVAFLALAKSLATGDDKVGVLDGHGLYSGGSATGRVAAQFFGVNIITGNVPLIGRKIPLNSNVILGSDFFAKAEDQEEIIRAVGQLAERGVNGHICMVIDPVELDLRNVTGNKRFIGREGQTPFTKNKVQSIAPRFNEMMNKHIEWVRQLAHSNGFKFTLQRMDTEPLDLVLKIYGLNPGNPAPELHL